MNNKPYSLIVIALVIMVAILVFTCEAEVADDLSIINNPQDADRSAHS